MQLSHLKCALEVERTGSITQAAENLYMGQPNLSKIIRDLEDSVGIKIFKRGTKGVTATEAGREFLRYARSITADLEKIEQIKLGGTNTARLRVSISGAEWIADCIAGFTAQIDKDKPMKISLTEADTRSVVSGIADRTLDLGIVRIYTVDEPPFRRALKERGINSLCLWEYERVIVMSKDNPLARFDTAEESALADSIEIISGDDFLRRSQSLPTRYIRADNIGFCPPILTAADSFMRSAPVPEATLKKYSLVQRRAEKAERCRDFLIWHKNYSLTESDIEFRTYLCQYFSDLDSG